MFERSVGYDGESRFVAFYWGTCDELCFCDDSLASGTIDSAGWLIFTSHPFVRRHFSSFDFGTADLPARHCLLLDRKERRFHVGEKESVESFLEAYAFPGGKPVQPAGRKGTVTLDEFIVMAGNMEELLSREFCPEEMMRRLSARQAVCAELKEWLEKLR
jgi:hypothetical protein